MTEYKNWISNSTNTSWKHRHNHNVIVAIVKTLADIIIFHSHPGLMALLLCKSLRLQEV